MWNRPHDLPCWLVLPLPLIRDRPQKAALGPGQIGHFDHHFGPNPMHSTLCAIVHSLSAVPFSTSASAWSGVMRSIGSRFDHSAFCRPWSAVFARLASQNLWKRQHGERRAPLCPSTAHDTIRNMSNDTETTRYYVRGTDPTNDEQIAFECVGLGVANAKAAELRMGGYRDVILSAMKASEPGDSAT